MGNRVILVQIILSCELLSLCFDVFIYSVTLKQYTDKRSGYMVKNERSCTSTPPICLHGVERGTSLHMGNRILFLFSAIYYFANY
jgi:hypothetical protein